MPAVITKPMVTNVCAVRAALPRPPAMPAAQGGAAPGEKKRSFGDVMFTAMFIGLVSTYIGSYLGTWTSTGDFLPLAVAFVAGLAMAVFEYFARVKKVTWLDNFSMACSMLVGMGAAVLLGA